MNKSKGKKSKQLNKLDELLHIDHSDVYFENERLDGVLHRHVEELCKDLCRMTLQYDTDIQDLKHELENFKAIKDCSDHITLQNTEANKDSGGTKPRKGKKSKSRKSGRRRTTSDTDSDFDSDSSEDYHAKRRGVISSEGSEGEGSHAPDIKSYKLGKKSRSVKKFPKEWYTTVLPARDLPITRVKRQQSAPIGGLRRRNQTSRAKSSQPMYRTTSTTTISSRPDSVADDSGLKVICDKPVKPIVMSLRKLKEMSHIDNVTDKVPNKKAIKHQRMLENIQNRQEQLDIEIRTFIKDVGIKVAQDVEDTKEKEKEQELEYPDFNDPPEGAPES